MTDPQIVTRDLLMLTPKDWIIFYVACALGFLWFVLIMVRRLPLLLRDSLDWCKANLGSQKPAEVVNIDERRRRIELEAAAGRRVS